MIMILLFEQQRTVASVDTIDISNALGMSEKAWPGRQHSQQRVTVKIEQTSTLLGIKSGKPHPWLAHILNACRAASNFILACLDL